LIEGTIMTTPSTTKPTAFIHHPLSLPILILILVLALGLTLAARGGETTPAPASAKPAHTAPAAADTKAGSGDVLDLFDGESLKGWTVTDFAGHGEVRVEPLKKVLSTRLAKPTEANAPKPPAAAGATGSVIVMDMGAILTGVSYTNPIPTVDYEVSFEAMRLDGNDFFCGFTFPVSDAHCSFIVGGWGGGVVGISSIDGFDASENETTKFKSFQSGRWYAVRVRITAAKLEAWLDQEKVVDVKIAGRRISLRPGEIEMSKPMGIAAYQTATALRNIQLRRLP
jgi:hypothetical protein